MAPGHARVLPLPPEFITPQDGAEKQDCERAAAWRWLARVGATPGGLPPPPPPPEPVRRPRSGHFPGCGQRPQACLHVGRPAFGWFGAIRFYRCQEPPQPGRHLGQTPHQVEADLPDFPGQGAVPHLGSATPAPAGAGDHVLGEPADIVEPVGGNRRLDGVRQVVSPVMGQQTVNPCQNGAGVARGHGGLDQRQLPAHLRNIGGVQRFGLPEFLNAVEFTVPVSRHGSNRLQQFGHPMPDRNQGRRPVGSGSGLRRGGQGRGDVTRHRRLPFWRVEQRRPRPQTVPWRRRPSGFRPGPGRPGLRPATPARPRRGHGTCSPWPDIC